QGDGDGAFIRRQERQQLARGRGGQLLEKHRAVVGRHVVQERRDVLRGQGLQQRRAGILLEVLEGRRRVLPWQQPEYDGLVLETEVRQQLAEIARRAVADHVAQARVVAGSKDGGELVRRPGDGPDGLQRLVAVRAVSF